MLTLLGSAAGVSCGSPSSRIRRDGVGVASGSRACGNHRENTANANSTNNIIRNLVEN